MIKVEHLSKIFRTQKVLDDVNISFSKGQIHGIIGGNGSGKTVLLKCICGLLCPSSGAITVNGQRIGRDTDFAPNTGVIIETPVFLSYRSGMGNLRDLAAIRRIAQRPEIEQAMCRVGLDSASKKRVGKYSLGMRQRLGIAQAIMESPDLLILDEPMNGLDKRGTQEIRQLLIDLRTEGKTIILASHNTEDIQILCDTVCEMDGGALTPIRGFERIG
jgi:ABC-2 type transport system ATP-binding protein